MLEGLMHGLMGSLKVMGAGTKIGYKAGKYVTSPGHWASGVRSTMKKTLDFVGGGEGGDNMLIRGADKLDHRFAEFRHNFNHYWTGQHLSEGIRGTWHGRALAGFDALVTRPAMWGLDKTVALGTKLALAPITLPASAALGAASFGLRAAHGLLKAPVLLGMSPYRFAGELTANIGKDLSRGLAHEAGQVLKGGYKAGKFIWQRRNSPTMKVAMFATALGVPTMAGGIEGASEYGMGRTLPMDDMQMTFMNPQPTDFSRIGGGSGEIPEKRFIDNFGATGDLVFALNNLRNRGMM